MAARFGAEILKTKLQSPLKTAVFNARYNLFHTSPVCSEVQSGRVKTTPKRNKPITYEQSLKPHDIGRRKAWNSWNTSTLEGGLKPAEIALDDVFIRKFIVGTFPEMVVSEVIIKRQYNIIRIAFLMRPRANPSAVCFLIGYTETLLSYWFQCIVKLEIQTVKNYQDVIFQYI